MRPKGAITMGHMVCRLDENDVIVHVKGALRRVARAVSVPDLPDAALGSSIWNFIADDELRAVYMALVARARAGRTVRVQTRCDSPSLARTVEIEISPLPEGGVEIAYSVGGACVEGPATPRASGPLRLCAWCYRADRGGVWRAIEDVVVEEQLLEQPTVPVVTHGICDDCLADAAAKLESAAAA